MLVVQWHEATCTYLQRMQRAVFARVGESIGSTVTLSGTYNAAGIVVACLGGGVGSIMEVWRVLVSDFSVGGYWCGCASARAR